MRHDNATPTTTVPAHPEWGAFTWDGGAWTGTVAVPEFDVFTYDTDYGQSSPPTGTYELAFEAETAEERLPDAAVAVAAQLLAEPRTLVSTICTALWDDFNGRGFNSGMWWHDDLESVSEEMETPPANAADLRPLLRLQRIIIRRGGGDSPVAELNFRAAFEEEHGVGILTDGRAILGAGYSYDVSPYRTLDADDTVE